ncbi:hypothetical protein A4S06_00115 [Erysipelotrichaceae bacterium MTC7]|nr:hypothetical protein A4S06_00115 [Erysipelotrichaceae bacterium MTC7]
MRNYLNNKTHIFCIAIVVGLVVWYPVIQELMQFNNPNYLQYGLIAFGIVAFIYGFLTYLCVGWSEKEKRMVCMGYFIIVMLLLLGRTPVYSASFQLSGLNPFSFIQDMQSGHMYLMQLVVLNVLLFIPAPLVLHVFVKSKFCLFSLSVGFGILMEVLQLVLHRGAFDLSDISLYVIGILCGLMVLHAYQWLEHRLSTSSE